MAAESYVVVDVQSHTILDGPYLVDLDENPDWEPPVPGTLMLTAEAESQGYSWPEPPADPATVMRDKLMVGLAANGGFLGIGSPSDAELAAQVQALTRQVNAMIRFTFGMFETDSDT